MAKFSLEYFPSMIGALIMFSLHTAYIRINKSIGTLENLCPNLYAKGQKIWKANYDVVGSSRKRTQHTQDTILSVLRSFFGRIGDFIICF